MNKMNSKKNLLVALLFLFCVTFQIKAQSPSFKLTERALPATIYPNNASIVQNSVPLKKIQKDFYNKLLFLVL